VKYDLLDEINDALKARTDWEERQTTFYKMRHEGLRRRFKPWPGAADLHFPLIDSLTDRIKPFYFQQLYATETLASFVSLKDQSDDLTTATGYWFDYQLKQKSNLEEEILSAIDYMAGTNGWAPAKVYWDCDNKQLCFDAIDPLHVIVPVGTKDFADADWIVHVLHYSSAAYERNARFRQGADFIKSIKGRGNKTSGGSNSKEQEVSRREGINYGQNDDQIVLWEIHRKRDDKWWVETISPLRPETDNEIRAPFVFPYKFGRPTFVRFRTEIKDKGWYSPRGIAERVASFETSITKQWNSEHDWMDHFNNPMYESDFDLPNTQNIRRAPGQILPKGLHQAQTSGPPISFKENMAHTRSVAEYLIGIPDLGSTEHLTPGDKGGGKVTATQINAIVGQSGQNNDIRARVFRLDLAKLYRMSYSILMQYAKDSLTFVLNGAVEKIDGQALHQGYEISPNGSADSWNKGQQLQKAVMRKQLFQGSPWIKQGELDKSCLELDDPRLVKRLYQDPQQEQTLEAEEQAQEIVVMREGWPAAVMPADDDKAHLQTMDQYVLHNAQTNEHPITPALAKLLLQHGAAHDQQLAQKKDPQLPMIRQKLKQSISFLMQVAAQAPTNVVPMQPGGPADGVTLSPTSGPVASGQTKAPDPIQDASKLMTSFAAMSKAGQPVGVDQINAVLAIAGMPPLRVVTAPAQPAPVPAEA
jgi:hypothetical protein